MVLAYDDEESTEPLLLLLLLLVTLLALLFALGLLSTFPLLALLWLFIVELALLFISLLLVLVLVVLSEEGDAIRSIIEALLLVALAAIREEPRALDMRSMTG